MYLNTSAILINLATFVTKELSSSFFPFLDLIGDDEFWEDEIDRRSDAATRFFC